MKVLVVEDSDDVGRVTIEYLRELGHDGVRVADAEEALSLLPDAKFDALMTDIRLPGMSGIKLALELLKQYPDLPVLICSGYGSINLEHVLGYKPRSIFVLPKPYDLSALRGTLTQAAALGRQGSL
ncbi:MAG TPA: response regulator [Steroidobacteraceae bacterium]|jgi:DNA-binding NtrC family response regulator